MLDDNKTVYTWSIWVTQSQKLSQTVLPFVELSVIYLSWLFYMQKFWFKPEILTSNSLGGFLMFPRAQQRVKKPLVELSGCWSVCLQLPRTSGRQETVQEFLLSFQCLCEATWKAAKEWVWWRYHGRQKTGFSGMSFLTSLWKTLSKFHSVISELVITLNKGEIRRTWRILL